MQEREGGRDTDVYVLFCFVMPICLFVAFESMSQTFPNILFPTKQGGQ